MGEAKQGDVVAVTIKIPERVGWSVGDQRGKTVEGLLKALAGMQGSPAALALTVIWEGR